MGYALSKLKMIFTIFVLLTCAACLTPEDSENLDELFEPEFPDATDPVDVEASCFNQRFVQPEGENTKEIDILFVTDTSGSLNQERAAIADGIDSFIDQLPSDTDFRLGLMLAHGSGSGHHGELYQANSEPVVLSSETDTRAEIRADFRTKMENTVGESASDGGEEGLFSLQKGIENNLASLKAQGFFRDNAALAVIFVADENDICARYPEGITPVPDPNGKEIPAFQRDCQDVTPESLVQTLRGLKGEKPLMLGAIIYDNPATVPQGGENEVGYGYLEAVQMDAGIVVDLASGQYQAGLAEMGRLATVKIETVSDFTLSQTEIDEDTLEVQVDGTDVPFIYTIETNIVHLDFAGGPRSTVDINYCLPPEEPVNPRDQDGDGLDDETGEPLY